MLTETLKAELAGALKKRLAVIGDQALRATDPDRHLAELRAASERISALQKQLPPDIDPHLRHYLERCSYDKALAWVEQNDLPAGAK